MHFDGRIRKLNAKKIFQTTIPAQAILFCVLFQSIEALLQNLPVLQSFEFFRACGIDFAFIRVFRRPIDLVENSEQAWKWLIGELVRRIFICHIVIGRHSIEDSSFTRVGRIKRSFVELNAFAQTLNDTKSIVVHGCFHHLQDMIRICMRGTCDKGCSGGDQLLHRVDGLIDCAPDVSLAFKSQRRRGGGLLFGQAIHEIIHDHIGHFDILASRMVHMVASNRKRVAVTPKNKYMQVRPA
ncbi:MAG: hypothetical protein JWM99_3120 [Verrucomicrobiales bacterium]|nr:hypothetical protein [Verrucomicrobiales bacterium]